MHGIACVEGGLYDREVARASSVQPSPHGREERFSRTLPWHHTARSPQGTLLKHAAETMQARRRWEKGNKFSPHANDLSLLF